MKTVATSKNFEIVNFGAETYFVNNSIGDCDFATRSLKKAINYVNRVEKCLTQGTPSVAVIC